MSFGCGTKVCQALVGLACLAALSGASAQPNPASPAPAHSSPAPAPTGRLDVAGETRLAEIANELRCMVCQNQSIGDSHAPLAVDLRNQIREQILSGKTDREIREFMVERYGDFVLYRPPFKASTALLWVGPFLLLLIGGWIWRRQVMTRSKAQSALAVSGATPEHPLDQRLDKLLGKAGE
jgi:cytochrome c-type biogenesis protein CcmH